MPELAGINATFAYHLSDDGDNSPADAGTWSAGGTGKWGPIEVALKYLHAATEGDIKDIDQASAGIRYKGNGLTAAYQYEDVDLGGSVRVNGLRVGSAGEGKFNFVNLGYKFGNTLIAGNFGGFKAKGDGADLDYWAIGAKYYFDKKVNAYLGYASTKVQNDDTYDTFGIGMRYDF
jgi:predicted porin